MEFWLYSANLEDGEMLFLWQGGSQLLEQPQPPGLTRRAAHGLL
jgi:hypothetical protein